MLVHFNVPGGGDTNAGAWLTSFGGHGVLVANRRTGHSLTERPSPADDHKQVRGDLDTKQRPDKGLRASSSGLSTLFSGSYTNCTTWRMGLSFDDHGFIDGPDQRVQKGRTCRQPRKSVAVPFSSHFHASSPLCDCQKAREHGKSRAYTEQSGFNDDCNAYFNILGKRFLGMAAKPTVMPI